MGIYFPCRQEQTIYPVSRGTVFFAQGAFVTSKHEPGAESHRSLLQVGERAYIISVILGLGIGETLFGRLDREYDRIPH